MDKFVKNIIIIIISLLTLYFLGYSSDFNKNIISIYKNNPEYIYFFVTFLFVSIFLLTILDLIKSINTINKTNSNRVINNFEKSLLQYILERKKFENKTYVIEGKWGSGKTYRVNTFISKFFEGTKFKIYRISCFGLDSRESLEKELIKQIEDNDSRVIVWLKYIPLIGDLLHSIIIGSYSLNNISKKGIIIFDDFERITALGVYNYNEYVNVDHSIRFEKLTSFRKESWPGYREIDKNFELTKNLLTQQYKRNRYIDENKFMNTEIQKYNIATGLINNLVETYNLPVIVLCNNDILGKKFFDTIFRGKLDCITYYQNINETIVENIFDNVLINTIIDDNNLKENILSNKEFLSEQLVKVYKDTDTLDLRSSKSIVQSYLEILLIIFKEYKLSDKLIRDLFLNIILFKLLQASNNSDILLNFKSGSNLIFQLDCFLESRKELSYFTKNIEDMSDTVWIDTNIVTFWELNLESPLISEKFKSLESYKFNDLEKKLIINNEKSNEIIFNDNKFLATHLAFFDKNEENRSTFDNKKESNINMSNLDLDFYEETLENLNTEERVIYILYEYNKINSGVGERFYKLSDYLSDYYGIVRINDNNGYNSFLIDSFNRRYDDTADKNSAY